LSHIKELERAFRVYAPYFLFCIKTNPSRSILNLRLVGDTMAVTQEIFIVEFGHESRFLFHHTKVTTICHPLKGKFII
jgi:hypothetical protein